MDSNRALTPILFAILLAAASFSLQAAPVARCDPNYIPKPVTSSAGWLGPKFLILTGGIQFLAPERFKSGLFVSPEALRSTLLSLTPEDWPQGCFVDVFEQGIRSGNDDELINRHFQELEQTLRGIGVRIRFITSA